MGVQNGELPNKEYMNIQISRNNWQDTVFKVNKIPREIKLRSRNESLCRILLKIHEASVIIDHLRPLIMLMISSGIFVTTAINHAIR